MMLKKTSNNFASDKEVILSLQNGDDLALNEIMSRYKVKLFPFIYNYTKDEDVAQDILQEVFVKLYFKAKTYNPQYSFSTWIHRIAINLCHDYYRKQKLRSYLSLDNNHSESKEKSYHETIADPNSNTEDLVQLRESLSNLGKEVVRLPHKLRTALILFVLEGNSQEECAKILNTTAKTIETRVYRARKILAKKIAINF